MLVWTCTKLMLKNRKPFKSKSISWRSWYVYNEWKRFISERDDRLSKGRRHWIKILGPYIKGCAVNCLLNRVKRNIITTFQESELHDKNRYTGIILTEYLSILIVNITEDLAVSNVLLYNSTLNTKLLILLKIILLIFKLKTFSDC